MPIYSISHTTRYKYAGKVANSANQIILFPKSEGNQSILEQHLTLSPTADVDYFYDYFDNKVGMFTIIEPHEELTILSELRVKTTGIPIPQITWSPQKQWAHLREIAERHPYIDFVQPEKFESQAEVTALLEEFVSPEKGIMEAVRDVSSYIHRHFHYQQGVTTVETQIDEVWKAKTGVCQDFTHMMIAMLRSVGIPSRYVSGYICPCNGQEMRGEGATHAWTEVYIPSYGWMGNDPTNNCWVDDRHVKIAFGRDFKDCTPVKGTYEGSAPHTLHVSVKIKGDDGSASGLVSEAPDDVAVAPNKHPSPKERLENDDAINSYQRYIQQQQQQQQ